jgi:hypothetical protein
VSACLADPSKKVENSYLGRALAEIFNYAERTVLVAILLIDSKGDGRAYYVFQIFERAFSSSISTLNQLLYNI